MIFRSTEFHRLDLSARGRVGVTSGCFDLLHFYHLQYLEKCKALCDFLIVGVDADALIETQKKKTPVIDQHQRMMMVEALRCVDAAFIMTTLDDLFYLSGRVHAVFKNSQSIYGNSILDAFGQNLMIVPDIAPATSTTEIVGRIQASAVQQSKQKPQQ